MAARSVWKGTLKLALITCPVKLYKATEDPDRDRISFARINRKTGNKVDQKLVDAVTGAEVISDDVAKGVLVAPGKYVEVTQDEIDAAAPASAETIEIRQFAAPDNVDAIHFEDFYFLSPDGDAAMEAFALLRIALYELGVVAIGYLARGTRERLVALAPCGLGMTVTQLRPSNEVRDGADCFARLTAAAPPDALMRMALRLVSSRQENFDGLHDDAYQAALAELVRSKVAGTMVKARIPPKPPKLIPLADAVRKSVEKSERKRA